MEGQALQPEKTKLLSGAAVSVSVAPLIGDAVHVPPQSMPGPVTRPVPVPLRATSSVPRGSRNSAPTLTTGPPSAASGTSQVSPVPEHAPVHLPKSLPSEGDASSRTAGAGNAAAQTAP